MLASITRLSSKNDRLLGRRDQNNEIFLKKILIWGYRQLMYYKLLRTNRLQEMLIWRSENYISNIWFEKWNYRTQVKV